MSAPMRTGALFAGYGGIELALAEVLDVELAWVSEFDAAPSKILAHHWPDVPNLGDVTAIDWTQVEPVDVITGGSPCQDLSHAGKRAGMKAGTRSGLWASMCDAIETIRPRLVIWENVRGALSAEAVGAVEPCPFCVGDRPGVCLRALGRVLGDLAELGYDTAWCGLRAADVGAPHGRWRIFVLAWPSDDTAPILTTAGAGGVDGGPAALRLLPTPAVNDMGQSYTPDGWDGWTARMKSEHGNGNGHGASLSVEALRLLPTPMTTDGGSNRGDRLLPGVAVDLNGDDDAHSSEAGSSEVLSRLRRTTHQEAVHERTPRGPRRVPAPESLLAGVCEHEGGGHEGRASLAGPEVPGRLLPGVRYDQGPARASHRPESAERRPPESGDPLCVVSPAPALAGGPSEACGCDAWGQYGPAIHRWELILGRIAPSPTEPSGKNGAHRLSPRAVEFMMGLPDGHVTDPAIGISRAAELKALGNGVCPQQCAAAIRHLLGVRASAIAEGVAA